MRNIDQHAESIHLVHNIFAKVSQAVVLLFAARGVGPIIRVVPRQRHVAHAQSIEFTQRRQRVLDRVSTFDTH